MVIKKAVFKKQRKTINVKISEEVYGCDCCREPIDHDKNYLRATVFSHTKTPDSTQIELCSWKCFAKFIKTVTTDYFVSLPYVSFDEKTPGLRAKDFLKILK